MFTEYDVEKSWCEYQVKVIWPKCGHVKVITVIWPSDDRFYESLLLQGSTLTFESHWPSPHWLIIVLHYACGSVIHTSHE